jgi:hypothetical protein
VVDLTESPIVEEVFEVHENGTVRPATGILIEKGLPGPAQKVTKTTKVATAGWNKHLRAQFGRHRTFCQEIMVAPCGLIGYHTMYYGAEGVVSVAVSLHSGSNILTY